MGFRERWSESLKELLDRFKNKGAMAPEDFRHHLLELMKYSAHRGADLARQAPKRTLDEIAKEVREGGATVDAIQQHRNQLENEYRRVRDQLHVFADVRGEDDRAHVRETRRNLRYRIFTAIGIGLVVLGIYALAQLLGIQLPMTNPRAMVVG